MYISSWCCCCTSSVEFSSNFSLEISTALAAGCSVIVKPDVSTPGSVMEIIDICKEAGVPPGVVNLLSGDPASISSELIQSDIIKKISITGSTRVGKLILKQAADKVQRVTMELSGHSPFIVFDDVDLNKVTDMAITAKFRNNGQVCISPNRFYIHEKKDEFADLMVQKLKNSKWVMEWTKIHCLVLYAQKKD